jgi:hypothetical protein
MTNPTYAIAISSDDVSFEEFDAYLNGNPVFTLVREPIPPKEGRSFQDYIFYLTVANQLTSGVLTNALYEFLKWSFTKHEETGAEPDAVISLNNGITYTIDGTLPNAELREKIRACLLEGDLKSIHFDS